MILSSAKAKYSTDLCIYTLKEVINHYKSHSSHVFLCFVNAKRHLTLLITGHYSIS